MELLIGLSLSSTYRLQVTEGVRMNEQDMHDLALFEAQALFLDDVRAVGNIFLDRRAPLKL
jgi:hypothetical protein